MELVVFLLLLDVQVIMVHKHNVLNSKEIVALIFVGDYLLQHQQHANKNNVLTTLLQPLILNVIVSSLKQLMHHILFVLLMEEDVLIMEVNNVLV